MAWVYHERMNRNLAQGLLNIQYLIDPDVISLGGSISQNPDFIKGVQKQQMLLSKLMKNTIAPVIQACTYQADANLYGALVNWLQEENNGNFYRTQSQTSPIYREVLKITFLYQMQKLAVAQSDQAISIKGEDGQYQ